MNKPMATVKQNSKVLFAKRAVTAILGVTALILLMWLEF